MSTTELLRAEWAAFRRPGRLIALAVAALTVIGLGLLSTLNMHTSCPGPCPAVPVADDGSIVSDQFWFLHRDLGREGGITVRMTSMTGTITYPPPEHDRIVSGLVPWAKAGIIVKDGVRQGSRYAALMMTGGHGVRFQHDYRHDVAGSAGGVSARAPRWLRLTRSGDVITGSESADGSRWRTVATATLDGLPDTVRVGLFAASPGDLTLREVGLGGAIEEVRFTQAVGVFDDVTVEGGATGGWDSDSVGEMNHTDWERLHHASGAVEKDGVITISGTGDIGPLGEGGVRGVETTLPGLPFALIIVVVAAARYGTRTAGETASRQVIVARALVLAGAGFVTGLVAVGVVLPAGMASLRASGVVVPSPPLLTGVRVVVGLAAVLALCAVLAYGLGVRLRRGGPAILAGVSLIVLPYVVTAFPLLPDAVSDWLLRLTPAAAFAVKQTVLEYPQVTEHYAPSAGYFPLPGWAGLTLLCAYTALGMLIAVGRKRAAEPGRR
ncbi:hypothetical protein [Sphaerisporangium sp. TRM90804]|uniref:hypothetical protein n=1 Tax=Sphaerisporangium sp. TRM90804 TaxID=3031113 RepID=UPI00244C8DF1|nr:hypothetical protein [Sphaerisporangium sp. TRM90804]MDH2430495.1 hypothetical protein [Sphaerisporangium sp. TRM90804]